MACDTGVKAIDSNNEKTSASNDQNLSTKENKNMSSSLVLRKMPAFETMAYDAATGHYKKVSSQDYEGKWTLICFYPADFTFVCPTEIAAMNAHLDEITGELGVEVLAASTDTHFSHKRFVETEPILKGLKMTIAADPKGDMARAFGVMIEEEGLALRGRFLINPEGVVVAQEVQAPMVGRNVQELIRQIRAWQHATQTGEVCPAGWRPGKKTLPVNTDAEKMTGRVGDYITLEELLS
ncbi:peroxiredoxin [Wolinella succinogenes]|uniref:peroxiredoxin n=1 Tax=Wolinella succinogenes TaxID=844 RepID=UPI00240A3DFF|nr:peroxiredoxin [Wolinella succinogenes]